MNLLFVSCLLPYPRVTHGGGTDLYHLIESLNRHHEVHLISIASEAELPHVNEMRGRCASLQTVMPAWTLAQKWRNLRQGLLADPIHIGQRAQRAMRAHIREAIERYSIDVVQFEWTETSRYRDAVLPGTAIAVLDEVDVSFRPRLHRAAHVRFGLPRAWAELRARHARRNELATCSRFGLVLVRSEFDRCLLLAARENLRVEVLLPWTHMARFRDISPQTREPGRLLFVGAMDRDENCEAVEYFCQHIFSRVRAACPQLRLEIAGASPQPRIRRLVQDPAVTVTGFLPDLREAYERCDVFVAPMRAPGGVFNKIVDAMAAGRPVVTTSIGNEGIAAPPGEAVLVADDPIGFAEHVIGLLTNRDRWRRIADAGRRHVQAVYDWDANVGRLETLYGELIAVRGGQPRTRSS